MFCSRGTRPACPTDTETQNQQATVSKQREETWQMKVLKAVRT